MLRVFFLLKSLAKFGVSCVLWRCLSHEMGTNYAETGSWGDIAEDSDI